MRQNGNPGPSPRVRGSLLLVCVHRRHEGSIPACAGKPGDSRSGGRRTRVHPRVCGEAASTDAPGPRRRGPSPRVRGSPCTASSSRRRRRSIPACAGKPRHRPPTRDWPGVHPRVCGEAATGATGAALDAGPSPRVRGSPVADLLGGADAGSIPACAGKPSGGPLAAERGRVHPRVCGEAGAAGAAHCGGTGPSPRVRGSLGAIRAGRSMLGSIPACAGKPASRRCGRTGSRVHPRVCGEANACTPLAAVLQGPSPRVRGSLRNLHDRSTARGSIPACAGKPGGAGVAGGAGAVHPRVCGEATTR